MSEAINEYGQENMMSEQTVPQKPKPKRPARPRKKPAPAVSLDSIEAIMASVYDMDRADPDINEIVNTAQESGAAYLYSGRHFTAVVLSREAYADLTKGR